MTPFRFRLNSLENYRRQTRESRQLELAAVDAERRRLESQCHDIECQLAAQRHAVRGSIGPGRIDVVQLAAASDFECRLRGELEQLNRRASVLVAEVARCRQAVVEADRDVRTLEKLRERQYEQFQFEERRAESKSLDDTAARHLHGEPLA
jgi:flagellar export protein FliJ